MNDAGGRDGASTVGGVDASVAGVCMILAGGIAFMGIITGEVLYPGYSTRQDISDLGSTQPPNPIIQQPSATIFNGTMLMTGALLLIATYFIHRAWGRRILTVPLAVFGIGVFGVGVFPGNITPWHGLFALLTFFSGGITVVLSSRVVARPFAYLCVLFGGVSLLVLVSVFFYGLVLREPSPLAALGSGGIERWVAYPLLLWVPTFGGYLLGSDRSSRNH
ncbi:DUF998 domain-containing protein [Haladaptatus sp. AB643]|uniref:DUF998 domain-containing protein n=2 Tax=unclassified Haladaptatus TaxID=2622732 RepID=UPI00209C16D5|nr:DUF998 domain-containing protein [Haladaptatus sp. AB643]MCO8243520.1 DUF998 domain-containing protein [Haladaptatus sp. AB643]